MTGIQDPRLAPTATKEAGGIPGYFDSSSTDSLTDGDNSGGLAYSTTSTDTGGGRLIEFTYDDGIFGLVDGYRLYFTLIDSNCWIQETGFYDANGNTLLLDEWPSGEFSADVYEEIVANPDYNVDGCFIRIASTDGNTAGIELAAFEPHLSEVPIHTHNL